MFLRHNCIRSFVYLQFPLTSTRDRRVSLTFIRSLALVVFGIVTFAYSFHVVTSGSRIRSFGFVTWYSFLLPLLSMNRSAVAVVPAFVYDYWYPCDSARAEPDAVSQSQQQYALAGSVPVCVNLLQCKHPTLSLRLLQLVN